MTKKIIITESQYNRLFQLNENKESRNMKKAREVTRQLRPNADPMAVITAVRNDIPNSRLNNCQFLAGVTRIYLSDELKGSDVRKLNSTLKLVALGHANEYDNNLNGLTGKELIDRFATAVQNDVNASIDANSKRQFQTNNNYDIVKIPSYEDAEKYSQYVDWCITKYSSMYDSYTHGGTGVFYFLLKKGYKEIEPREGENCPLDEYGLSMIAVSINDDRSINTVTCRWNHANGGNDDILSDEQLSQLIGQDIYHVLKPRVVKLINENDRFIVRDIDGKRNIFDKKRQAPLKSDLDGCATFSDYSSFGKVDENGNIIIPANYFYIGAFDVDGYAVASNYTPTLVDKQGRELFESGVNSNIEEISKCNKEGTRLIKEYVNGKTIAYYVNFINHRKIGQPEYAVITNFDTDGRVIVTDKNDKAYLFNGDLSLALDPNFYDDIEYSGDYDKCRPFLKDGKWGLLDSNLLVLLEPRFDHISEDNLRKRDNRYERRVIIKGENGRKIGYFDYLKKNILWENKKFD